MADRPAAAPNKPPDSAAPDGSVADDVAGRIGLAERVLGYRFRDRGLLQRALTHASAVDMTGSDNERLEYLGDAILEWAVSQHLYDTFPGADEGVLTEMRAQIVSRKTLGKRAEALGLGPAIILGKGLSARGRIPTSIHAGVLEAVVAAVSEDAAAVGENGLAAAAAMCARLLEPDLVQLGAPGVAGLIANHKTQLQQITQRLTGDTPRYELLAARGPEHAKSFHVVAVVGERRFEPAWGDTKKSAEQRAAGKALLALQADHPDDAELAALHPIKL